ncbi:MAG: MBL fold metallo-hydrolase [Clostridiales Family XIII bacterium]|jgi:metallo-beta-lactamase family protein|nr:MBL fold metallo-hydrolase [Clostridiales Family XIII bacterium]
MKIKFCGAADGVTGSCHLVTADTDTREVNILLDCGQFQGGGSIEAQNYKPFPFSPAEIDFMILSHAHVDHCGRIPLLVKQGFHGSIYCTDATADLVSVMLRDSAYIHEKEAEWKSRKALRAGKSETMPLYTVRDAEASLKHVVPVGYDQLIEPLPGVKFVLNEAGHIIGSSIIELWTGRGDHNTKLVFSGDLGVVGRPMLRDPKLIKSADVVIMESTYGNRVHEEGDDSIQKLADILVSTVRRGGTVVIPSFAVGRTQELIYELNDFYEANSRYRDALKDVKVYIDSPMATAATEVFRKNTQSFDEAFRDKVLSGDDPLDFVNLRFTKSTEESKALNDTKEPKIIISASGMCEAGRIRHHLKHHLWERTSSIVFVGYQGEGTLGRKLLEGAKTVMLFGEEVTVNAQIHNLEGFSAHADRNGLLAWAKGFRVKPEAFFLVHGELQAKRDLAASIRDETGFMPIAVETYSEFKVDGGAARTDADVMSDIVSPESIEALRNRIAGVRKALESVLYKTELAASKENDPASVSDISNRLIRLEKETLGLAASVAEVPEKDPSP